MNQTKNKAVVNFGGKASGLFLVYLATSLVFLLLFVPPGSDDTAVIGFLVLWVLWGLLGLSLGLMAFFFKRMRLGLLAACILAILHTPALFFPSFILQKRLEHLPFKFWPTPATGMRIASGIPPISSRR